MGVVDNQARKKLDGIVWVLFLLQRFLIDFFGVKSLVRAFLFRFLLCCVLLYCVYFALLRILAYI